MAPASLKRRLRPVGVLVVLAPLLALAAPKRVLYVTHAAGFRHGSIIVSQQVLADLAAQSAGALEVVSTEDLSQISAENLRNFDVVFFFTSGNLALSDRQKQDFLAFVRGGKGFGGVHSASDTLYNWPEYGEMLGAYIDEHPWAQEVSIDVEDPDHPAMQGLGPSFRIADEIYQFTALSRDRVRVLMTLDTRTVDLRAPMVKRTDGDFALAWCRSYGSGRVFYTALGHPDEVWLDARFQTMMLNALLWLAGERAGDATPRSGSVAPAPAISSGGVVNAASFAPAPSNFVAPGSLISIFGANLTSGSTLAAAFLPLPVRLAGATVTVNGAPVPLLFASPRQINAQLPFEAAPGQPVNLVVTTPVNRTSAAEPLRIEAAAPGIFVITGSTRPGDALTIYATGLGPVNPSVASGAAAPLSPPSRTPTDPQVTIGGAPAAVTFSGLAPTFAGLYQVNVTIPPGIASGPAAVILEMGGRRSNAVNVTIGP